MIALGVTAVAAAGALLWKYWDRVTAVVGGFASRIGQELAPALQVIQPALDLLSPAIHAIGDSFKWASDKISEFSTWIGSFFQREVLTDDQKAGFAKAGSDVADAMINSIKDAFGRLLDWFKELPGKILSAIGNIDLSSLIHWPSPPGWLTRLMGGDAGPPAAATTADATGAPPSGHRAKGGPVWPGSSFLVGEHGPERFTPSTQGTISKAGSGGGVRDITINITTIGDARETARAVRKELEDALGAGLRGAHADSGAWS